MVENLSDELVSHHMGRHLARNLVIKGIEKINNYLAMGSYSEVATVYSDTLKELRSLLMLVPPNVIEPLIKDFPEHGAGGATQAVTKSKIKLKSLKKLE